MKIKEINELHQYMYLVFNREQWKIDIYIFILLIPKKIKEKDLISSDIYRITLLME